MMRSVKVLKGKSAGFDDRMNVSMKYITFGILGLLSFLILDITTDLYYVSSIGLSLVVFVFAKFFYDIGSKVDTRDIIAVASTIQWIFGPILAYHLFPEHPLFYMATGETEYMNYVVPACYALVMGLYIPLNQDRVIGENEFDRIREYMKSHPKLGYGIVAAGLLFTVIGRFLPRSLEFLFFLLGNMQFVGLFMLMLTPRARFKWLILSGVLFLLVSHAVLQGMFHELLLWLTFLFLIFALLFRFKLWMKTILFSLGLFLILVLQNVKEDYRDQTWYKSELEESKQHIFNDVFIDKLTNPSAMFGEEVMNNVNVRLNQGWIIARILHHVPQNEPYARGETIRKGIEAAVMPRILLPGKAVAGGKENFERFTGTPLNKNTSMDLSLAGEGYANFGRWGGVFFMLIMGLFYNIVLISIVRLSRNHPTLILWIPLLFFQVVKAETDFATVFNHLVKSIMVVWVVFWSIQRIFKIRI